MSSGSSVMARFVLVGLLGAAAAVGMETGAAWAAQVDPRPFEHDTARL